MDLWIFSGLIALSGTVSKLSRRRADSGSSFPVNDTEVTSSALWFSSYPILQLLHHLQPTLVQI